jgi:hypothetical protein
MSRKSRIRSSRQMAKSLQFIMDNNLKKMNSNEPRFDIIFIIFVLPFILLFIMLITMSYAEYRENKIKPKLLELKKSYKLKCNELPNIWSEEMKIEMKYKRDEIKELEYWENFSKCYDKNEFNSETLGTIFLWVYIFCLFIVCPML